MKNQKQTESRKQGKGERGKRFGGRKREIDEKNKRNAEKFLQDKKREQIKRGKSGERRR